MLISKLVFRAVSHRCSLQIFLDVQINSIRWAMVNQLKHPTPGFEDVVQRHFYMKQERIVEVCKKLKVHVVFCGRMIISCDVFEFFLDDRRMGVARLK